MSDPILQDFPYSFETERLTIRGSLPGDGRLVHEAVVETQEELVKWMPWAVEVPDEAWYEVWARNKQIEYLARKDLQMNLFLKGSQTFVGGGGLHRINWEVPKFEIGYWVRTSYGRQGYITEFVNGVTDFAFDTFGAKRVEIRCDSLNERSAAVARRAGYELEAILRHHDRHHLTGALRDTLIFTKLRP